MRPKTGSILIAEPFMMDPNFKRAVMLLCDYDREEGAVAFILNRPVEYDIAEIFPEMDSYGISIYLGGPVAQNTLHYIHSAGDVLDDSVQVLPGVYWGGDFDKLKFLVENGVIRPDQIRFYIGYAGWTGGQLEEELKEGSWVLSEGDPNYVFHKEANELWQLSLMHLGGNHELIAQIPDHQNAN